MAGLYFDLALQKDPKNAGLWLEEARAAELDGDWGRAQQGYDRALALDGSLAEAWLGIGNVSIATGRYDEALQSFNEILAGNSSDPKAKEGKSRALVGLGQLQLARGNDSQARAIFEEAAARSREWEAKQAWSGSDARGPAAGQRALLGGFEEL